jgi:hypothetical protein
MWPRSSGAILAECGGLHREEDHMIGTLNDLVDLVEHNTGAAIVVAAIARRHGTTEYHSGSRP